MKTKLPSLLFLTILAFTTFAGNLRNSISTEYYLQHARDVAGDPESRIAYYDSAIISQGKDVLPATYFEKAAIYESRGFYPKALDVYHEASRHIDTTAVNDYCHLLLNSSVAAYHSNKMREAIQNAYSIFAVHKPDSLLHYDMDAYRLLSFITSRSSNYPLALRFIDKAWENYKRCASHIPDLNRRKEMLCRLYFAQSQVSMGQRKWQLAFDQLKKAEQEAVDPLMKADIYGAMGRLCELCDNLTAAGDFYRKALSFEDTHPNRAVNLDYYIRLQLRLGNVELARDLLNENRQLLDAFVGSQAEPQVEMLRYHVAKALGDNASALASLERVVDINESVALAQDSTYIREVISEYENRDVEKERIRMTKAIDKRNHIIIALAVVAMILLTAGIILWYLRRKARHENKSLADKIRSINRLHTEQHRSYSDNIDSQRKKLLTMSMNYKNITDALNDTYNLCDDKEKSPEKRLESIRSILKQLSTRNNVAKMFSIYFEGINETFFNRLFKLHPNLSHAEIRMSGFIHIGLTTKEIATLTNRSVRTVENIKYTLRKKLDIEESSETYFRRIMALSEEEFADYLGSREERKED